MHSFQPSRGRIFFEVLCVLTFAASFAVAWLQTKASAFLPLVAVSLLYALIHLFDMRRRPMAEIEAATPQRIDFAPEPQESRVAEVEEVAPMALVEPQPIAAAVPDVEPGEAAEPAAARSDAGRRKGGSRKGSGRRTKGSEQATVVELLPPEQEQDVARPEPIGDPDFGEHASFEEDYHAPIAPLFEPEPFARQQRVMFGRKAR